MLTKFAKPYEKSHEKNLNCFERYDALFEIKNNFQFLVLGTPEGYPALDPFNFIKVDSKFGIMTQSSVYALVYALVNTISQSCVSVMCLVTSVNGRKVGCRAGSCVAT